NRNTTLSSSLFSTQPPPLATELTLPFSIQTLESRCSPGLAVVRLIPVESQCHHPNTPQGVVSSNHRRVVGF
ncbi:hypothetical protein A2U01_0036568, partial [Trifolium medium]|nr:hypothetical protein [Trifolium medium]